MKHIHIICVACLIAQVLASCSLRETAIAPVELFIGHKTAVDMGLKQETDKPLNKSMDENWNKATKTQEYKLTCAVLVEGWLYVHPKPAWVSVAEKVDQYAP